MFPFDKKAMAICKEHKLVFFEHINRVVYGEYTNNAYIARSLPGMAIENKEELEFIFATIGKEYVRIIGPHYIEFLDPDVVEYETVSAPLCIVKDGHFTYANQKYTGKVPSKRMLEAAESMYPVITMTLKPRLLKLRENKLYIDFFTNSFDGISAVIYSYLSEDKISKDFMVLLKRRANNCNIFFIVNKTALWNAKKSEYIEFVIPQKHYTFISSRQAYIEKRLKIPIYLKSRATPNNEKPFL